MLYMIAQPTRKEPNKLPRYEGLWHDKAKGKEVTADEIFNELMEG